MTQLPTVYLIPCYLHESSEKVIAPYVIEALRQCKIFFVEEIRTARRFLKQFDNEIVIDDFEWVKIHKQETEVIPEFINGLESGKIIGILSEAGCPGIADPGQHLIAKAQQFGAIIKPLVGPNAILLSLMASGMNGQRFRFHGYLPIEKTERKVSLTSMENAAQKFDETHIFIETPYRNDQLIEEMFRTLHDQTLICIAVNITSPFEFIKTKTVKQWKSEKPLIGKHPAIFLLYSVRN